MEQILALAYRNALETIANNADTIFALQAKLTLAENRIAELQTPAPAKTPSQPAPAADLEDMD